MQGAKVYIPDSKLIWRPATVISTDTTGNKLRVKLDSYQCDTTIQSKDENNEERDIDLSREDMPNVLPMQNAHKDEGTSDMSTLNHLHEAAIVDNLRIRFFASLPYTYTGKIVIAVNPYRWMNDLYANDKRSSYANAKWGELPPHVYATSAEAYKQMKTQQVPQSILVSGESGSGKTETVKILMEHLATIANNNVTNFKGKKNIPDSMQQDGHHAIVQRVLKSNPLLEAFGNAKTIRNNNSSRFGKFTQLIFDSNYCLVGAECRHYLLEKSRVVVQAPGERNYHIFYQLVSSQDSIFGFNKQSKVQDFRYLSGDTDINLELEKQNYIETCDALRTIGVDEDESNAMFSVLCGILRLGQLDFVALPSEAGVDEASQPRASLVMDNIDTSNIQGSVEEFSHEISQQRMELEIAAELLGVDTELLSQRMCSRTVKAREEIYCVPLSQQKASDNRDALAKELYARLFAYLVQRVNSSISAANDTTLRGQTDHTFYPKMTATHRHIDLLDIFGFESFPQNGFEQFCINFANEKLQQKFNNDVFQMVQEEYTNELASYQNTSGNPAESTKWTWELMNYEDNNDILDLLESSMGLMSLLNEECVRPMGSDNAFTSKILTLHDGNPRMLRPRGNITSSEHYFTLFHYAGNVKYDAKGFVEKNRDALQTDLVDLLATSKKSLVQALFQKKVDRLSTSSKEDDSQLRLSSMSSTSRLTGGRVSELYTQNLSQIRHSAVDHSSRDLKTKKFMQETVCYKFKAQLSQLMREINITEAHYIRCVKPNDNKSHGKFDIPEVLHQLRSAGLIEAVRVTRATFPNKMDLELFLVRYVVLRSTLPKGENKQNSAAFSTLAAACDSLAGGILAKYPAPQQKQVHHIVNPPPYVVGKTLIYFSGDIFEWIENLRTRLLHEKATVLQRVVRSFLTRKQWVMLKRMIIRLQAHARRHQLQQLYKNKKLASVLIQSYWRGYKARKYLLLLANIRRLTNIQAVVRGYIVFKRYRKYRQATIQVQAWIKAIQQRNRYKSMLVEKKEFLKMEAEVNRLRQELQEEKKARLEMEAINITLQEALAEKTPSSNVDDRTSSQLRMSLDADLLPPYIKPGQIVPTPSTSNTLPQLDEAGPYIRESKNLSILSSRSDSNVDYQTLSAADPESTQDARVNPKLRTLSSRDLQSSLYLLDDSDKMLEFLRKEYRKSRDIISQLKMENENLRSENKKVKDAYQAVGASFAAINQHNKQQSKANINLLGSQAALIKSRDEKVKKFQRQISQLKADFTIQRSIYAKEIITRGQLQDTLEQILKLVSGSKMIEHHISEEIQSIGQDVLNQAGQKIDPQIVETAAASELPSHSTPIKKKIINIRENLVESKHKNSDPLIYDGRDRRATIDEIALAKNGVENGHNQSVVQGRSRRESLDWNHGQADRVTHVNGGENVLIPVKHESNRRSLDSHSDSRRKSKLGGMIKKIFKKEHEQNHGNR